MQVFFHFIFVFSILADSAQNVNALPQEKQKKRPLNGRLFVVFFGKNVADDILLINLARHLAR